MPRPTILVTLIAALVLSAIPLYKWRRPGTPGDVVERVPADEYTHARSTYLPGRHAPAVPAATVEPTVTIKLSPFETIRCVKRSPGRTRPERCEHLRFFEDALAAALRESADDGPKTITGATISVVMDIDFREERVKIYRGKSSTVARSRTTKLFRRLNAATPRPPWPITSRRHFKYVVNVKVRYPPVETF